MLATMNKPRVGPYLNRSFSNVSSFSSASEKPSFSSLFSDSNGHRNSDLFHCDSSSPISDDDDGVYLQISNLDQWYDEANLRNYLMTQLKPITPILSLTIETPSIAKVKVPSIQVRRVWRSSPFCCCTQCFVSLFSWFSLQSKSFLIYIARRWDISESLSRSWETRPQLSVLLCEIKLLGF